MPRYIDADLILPEMKSKFDMQELYLPVHYTVFNAPALYAQSRLTRDEYFAYIGNKTACIWYISDLKIYDIPKELNEFKVTRPPQSWCYVEEDV